MMKRPARTLMVAMITLVGGFGLSACTVFEPHVHNPAATDREHPNFGKELSSVEKAIVCYAARATTPQTVLGLARAECARYGLTARFLETRYTVCPALTPQAAVFSCLNPRTGKPPVLNSELGQ